MDLFFHLAKLLFGHAILGFSMKPTYGLVEHVPSGFRFG